MLITHINIIFFNFRILVGAPEGQSRFQDPGLVLRGGTVYKCRWDADDVCQQIPFDKTNNVGFINAAIDEKSSQWFGATLSSSGRKDGPVVACAPRYIWFTRELNRRDPVGTCFVSNGAFDNFEEYSPCRTVNWGYHRQGSCQAGFSAAINREGDRLYVGAPGSYYWQGQMYSIDAHAHFNYTPGFFGNPGYGAKGSVHQQSLETRPAVFSTREGTAPDDDSYIGYSTIAGSFKVGDAFEGIAVGMPRGNKLRGKVLLFTWDLINYKNITISRQIGSYFGYALAAADINGDKLLDLIVGAPMHTEPNTEDKYDVGRVYVFYQSRNFAESFNTSHFIDGTRSKGRFGHSLASLGDLNQDGYDDFAVGAPYDGPKGRGAVYIYYGSKMGIREKYGQVIYAESISGGSQYLTTFGFSVAGGLDLDNNEYPDMAVGAYLSDSAFFFRARPVIFLDGYAQFMTQNKTIDIKQKNCRLPNGQEGTCTSIAFCIKYFGKGIPDQLSLKVQYILDTKVKVPRMGFKSRGVHTFNSTISLRKDAAENCKTEEIFMKNEIRDKLTPLEAEVRFFMTDDYSYSTSRNPLGQLKPVLDLNNPPSRTDFIMIQNNCGEDNVCIPNLHVNVTPNVNEYLLGSNTTLEFDIIVSNLGEDSFETTFEMSYPINGIFYKKSDIKAPGMSCTQSQNKTVLCDIGNPLASGRIAKFKVQFQPYYQGGFPNRSYVFDIFVNSSNPEPLASLEDNKNHIEIDIWIDASLDIKGQTYSSLQPLSHYNETMYRGTMKEVKKESEIGPQITHVYYVTNKGPSQIQEAEIFILWPLTSLGGEDLLYLLEKPITMGNVKCEPHQFVNYKNLALETYSTSIWERLNIDVSVFGSGANAQKSTNEEKISEGKITETNGGIASGIGVVNRNESSIDVQINKSGGDSSNVIEQRHNESFTNEEVLTWGSLNPNGEYEYTVSKSYTVMVNGRPMTKWQNSTIIRDSQGHILRTLYFNDDTESQVGSDLNTLNLQIGLRQGEIEKKTAIWYKINDNGQEVIRWENRTVVTDLNGNVLRSYVFDDRTGDYVLETGTNRGQISSYQEELRRREQEIYEEQKRQEQYRQERIRQEEEEAQRLEQRRKLEEATKLAILQREREERQRIEEQNRQEEQRRRIEQQNLLTIEQKRQEEQRKRVEEQNRLAMERRKQDEERRRVEESRREEIRLREEEERKIEEERRKQEQQRITLEQRRQEEERRRMEESRRQGVTRYPDTRYPDSRYEVERRRMEERRRIEEERRRDDENRREQLRLTEERRRQEQIRTEQWRKQQEEQRRKEEERRRQQNVGGQTSWSEEEARRIYEERRRQQIGGQVGGFENNHKVVTGYFDESGNYHDAVRNPNEIVFNKTFVIESSTSYPIDISSGGSGQLGSAGINIDDLGSGFTVQTIGVGGGNSLDSRTSQESRDEFNRGFTGSGSRTYGQGSGSGQGQGGYRREWSSEGSYSTGGQIPPTLIHNSIERDNVDSGSRTSRSRAKRQIDDTPTDVQAIVKCNSTNCIQIRCVVGVLERDHDVFIALRSRLNVRALKELAGGDQPITLSSMMVAAITKLPYVEPIKKEKQMWKRHEIFTDVPAKEAELIPEVAPLWIYILSAVAGIVMLLLLIWLLSKCGFFKRNRPAPGPERQPLNRNGYHSGDEAL